mmetsp:Transcript_25727/g.42490  ORF Transcript_25727/g.42490 Transcript_25727/m.42490 type:complete len:476 (+) Transcript_25727:520-1947(+)
MPHSLPASISSTSSLTLRRDKSLPSYSIELPRRMRMFEPVRTIPSSTLQPATLPIAPILKVCNTSAVPIIVPRCLAGGGRMKVAILARTSSSRSYTIEYCLICTLLRSASSWVGRAATELKPSTIALETDASITSSAVIAPAPERRTRILTRSLSSETSSSSSDEQSASAEPWTSDLTTKSSTCTGSSPSLGPDKKDSRSCDERAAKSDDVRFVRSICCRTSAIWRAFVSSLVTIKASPAQGSPLRPTSSTAAEGPAASIGSPRASCSLRTFPHCAPATMIWPMRNVPFCTSAVATAPCPSTCLASRTTPAASRFGFAVRSSSSACNTTCSSSKSRPVPSLADTSAESTSPPNSSSTTSCSSSSVFTLLGSALGLSTLLTATMSGTLAALAARIEETVCSLTPSSAATTRITKSVTFAPRERIAENAAWPGVSMNVTTSPLDRLTADAPICCVMPPASLATTSDARSASSSEVLP